MEKRLQGILDVMRGILEENSSLCPNIKILSVTFV